MALLENLLRYCNGEFKNNENAEILYNVLASYLKSNEANNLYEVIETEEEIAATQKPFYDPTEAGYYFCLVTNTYNGTTASQTSRFFSVANA